MEQKTDTTILEALAHDTPRIDGYGAGAVRTRARCTGTRRHDYQLHHPARRTSRAPPAAAACDGDPPLIPAGLTDFLRILQKAVPENVFNPWTDRDPATDALPDAPGDRLDRLRRHLSVGARYLLIGEASGYQGCKVSGIPFTSERLILAGAIPRIPAASQRLTSRARPWSEPSATTVWGALQAAGIATSTVLWNAYPWHPFKAGTLHSNRTPSRQERQAGVPVLRALLDLYPKARVFAVGRNAEASLTELGIAATALRHPSMGGATPLRAAASESPG